MTEAHVLTVVATDLFGETSTETLVVHTLGQFVSLEPRDGKRLLVDAEELRAALEPKQEAKAA